MQSGPAADPSATGFRRRAARFRAAVVVTSVAVVLAAIAGAGCSNSPYTPQEMQGKVQFRTIGADPKSLDPSFSYTVDEALIVDLIYPTFYKYHYLKRDPFVLELNLGAKEPVKTAWPVTIKEKDGKTRTVQGERYSFTLKNDLRFQDDPCFPDGKGRHITAKDVVYSFKRMADPSVQCPVAPYFADKIVGWPEYSEAFEKAKEKNYDKEMEGVQLDPKDPYTFHVILNQPYPQLRYLMAMHFTAPQAREAVEYYKDEYPRHPVGCGPYYLSDYQPKQRLVLTVNPNRHKDVYPSIGMPGDAEAGLLADAGKQLPLTEKIVFNIIRESTSSWNLFTQGYLDAAGVNNNNFQQVFTASNALSPELEKKGVSLRKETEMCVYYFAFNMNDPVYGGLSEKNKKLRQAISLSINADEYIQLLKQGNASPAEWVLPPGVFGYDPSFQNPYRRFDPQLTRAKKLLAEAGYPDGVDPKTGEKLTLYYDNTATNAAGRQSVGIVSRMIERLGIKVVSRPSLPDQFQAKLLKGQHQFIFYGWYADYPDPENFVFLLYGPNKRPGPNSANYANPEYDRLFEQMRAMDDGPAREEVIRKMRAVSVEDCAWIPVIHNVAVSLTYDWVKNVKAHPLASDAAQYRNIDVDLRQSRQRAWNKPNFVPLVVLAAIIVVGSLPAVAVVRQRVNRRVRRADAGGEGDDS